MLNFENSSIISTLPPALCTNKSSPENSSACKCSSLSSESRQDREILDILEELQNPEPCISDLRTIGTRHDQLQGHFCSNIDVNLSNRALSENEIKVLGKGLDIVPIQRKINEPELRQYFEEFCRRMRTNEPSQDFSVAPAFASKYSWKPLSGHHNLEVFLSQDESKLFKEIQDTLCYSNLSQEEWRAVRSLADGRSIVIKKADKGFCVVVLFMRKSIIIKRFFLSWLTQVINTLRNLTVVVTFRVKK